MTIITPGGAKQQGRGWGLWPVNDQWGGHMHHLKAGSPRNGFMCTNFLKTCSPGEIGGRGVGQTGRTENKKKPTLGEPWSGCLRLCSNSGQRAGLSYWAPASHSPRAPQEASKFPGTPAPAFWRELLVWLLSAIGSKHRSIQKWKKDSEGSDRAPTVFTTCIKNCGWN